jgi:hypothetical protein
VEEGEVRLTLVGRNSGIISAKRAVLGTEPPSVRVMVSVGAAVAGADGSSRSIGAEAIAGQGWRAAQS